MNMLLSLQMRLRRFRRDDTGAASVEFVLIAPLYFALMLSTFEAGWLMTKSMMLERGMDLTMRDLRLGVHTNPTHNEFKQIICNNAAILKNCEATMLLELVPINTAADVPTSTICQDLANPVDPTVTFNATRGTREVETMFVRACVTIDPMIPGMGLALHLPKDVNGGIAMVSYGAFVNEPS